MRAYRIEVMEYNELPENFKKSELNDAMDSVRSRMFRSSVVEEEKIEPEAKELLKNKSYAMKGSNLIDISNMMSKIKAVGRIAKNR